jgi:hypothetical protein
MNTIPVSSHSVPQLHIHWALPPQRVLSFGTCFSLLLNNCQYWYCNRLHDRGVNARTAVGGMANARRNWSTHRKPAQMSLCPPQIPHDQSWDWTQATVCGPAVTPCTVTETYFGGVDISAYPSTLKTEAVQVRSLAISADLSTRLHGFRTPEDTSFIGTVGKHSNITIGTVFIWHSGW